MRRLVFLIVFVLLQPAMPAVMAQGQDDPGVLRAVQGAAQRSVPAIAHSAALTTCEITELRARLIADSSARRLFGPVLRAADRALGAPPSPLPRLFLEGVQPADPRHRTSSQSVRDLGSVEALGYAYAATGQPKYAERAGVYIEAWARTYQPDGNPINETEFARLARRDALVAAALSVSSRPGIEGWLSRLASLQIERIKPGADSSRNNWHSHRLKIVGLIGYALGQQAHIRFAEDGYWTQIGQNLLPDGSSFDFHQRDALHYHVYDLEPLVELAIASAKHRVNLYDYQAPSGASLARGLAFLLPYVRGEKVHPEFVNTKVEFDRQRAQAGVSGFQIGAPWDPRNAARRLETASYFDPALANEPVRGELRRTFQSVLNGLRPACSGR